MNTSRPTLTLHQSAGPSEDYELKRARKGYPCAHKAAHGWKIKAECAGDVQPGDYYVRTRQAWLEFAPVNLACLVAHGVAEVTQPAPRVDR
jgi:hypothetical protein